MRALSIPTAKVFAPLLSPARDKVARGGRGSGKSHFFAGLSVEDALAEPGESAGEGLRMVCIREVQKDLAQSAKLLIEGKISQFGLGEVDGFKVFEDCIKLPGDGLMIFKGMNNYTADSIKSLEGFKRAWWEEAHTASKKSINLLRPTLRASGSQLWWSYNPTLDTDPVDVMFRGDELPTGALIVDANWRDNPWFTAELEQERQDCMRMQPEQYDHIWEGGYITAAENAYFARHIAEAREQGRIGTLAKDPLQSTRAYWDIGVRDATAIWIVQQKGDHLRFIDHYEAVGQDLATHLAWLRSAGYADAEQVLPHDGAKQDAVTATRYEDHIRGAGFAVRTVPNQGKGAAMKRIEAARNLFGQMWFDEGKCAKGLKAIGWYHEKKNEGGYGVGPDHDWSSHCFTGDTEVLTDQGVVRFDQLPPTGLVFTPCGLKPYRNPRLTIANAPLVEVVFSDGHTVRCTPDHLFATGDGWKYARSLTPGSLILSTSMRSRSILTAVCIGLGLTRNTLAGAAGAFIAKCGALLSERYRRAVTSITGTEIRLTTGSITLSAWTGGSTSASLGTRAARRTGPSIFRPWRGIVPETGTSQMRGGSGTSATPLVPSSGQRTSGLSAPASNAGLFSWGWIVRLLRSRNTARPPVSAKPIVNRARHLLTPLRIVSVRPLSQRADVWDITVPGVECFALANGAVVHNSSDAFGLAAVDYRPPTRSVKIDYSKYERGRV